MRAKNIILLCLGTLLVTGRVTGQAENKFHLTPALDIYSSYVWRGTLLGKGPAFQPSIVFTTGGFVAGVWGSFDFNGYQEADPYVIYRFPFGLKIGLTDYFYPALKFSDFSAESGSHAFEINTGYTFKQFFLNANYIVNKAGGAGSAGDDLYFEAGYGSDILSVTLGAGDGWHTSTGNFNLCHIAIGAVRRISITDRFSLPLTGQVIFNPEREKLYVVAGISF